MTGLVAFAGNAGAVGTRTFELDTLEKLSGGDLHGTAIASDGSVRASFTTGSTPLNGASAVFASLVLPDGSVLLGTSPNGKILRVSGDQAEVYAETRTLAVTSLLAGPPGSGSVYAATMPEGKIYKVTKGKADVFATLPEVSSIWALAPARGGGFYAATGGDGKIFRVGEGGQASVYFTSEDSNVISLATADDGTLYAGSGSKGLLYKITGPGRGGVLYDFPGDDVKAIAVGAGGTVYAISNEYPEPPELGSRRPQGRAAPSPVATAHPKPGKGSLYRFDAQGRPERLMHHDELHYSSLALDGEGRAHVGTGAEGRSYSVDDAHVVTLEFDGDERQVGALAFATGGEIGVLRQQRSGRLPPHRRARRGRRGLDQQGARRRIARPLRAPRLPRERRSRGLDPQRRHAGSRRHVERVERRGRLGRRHHQPARPLPPGARPLVARCGRRPQRRDHPLRDREPAPHRHRGERGVQERAQCASRSPPARSCRAAEARSPSTIQW